MKTMESVCSQSVIECNQVGSYLPSVCNNKAINLRMTI